MKLRGNKLTQLLDSLDITKKDLENRIEKFFLENNIPLDESAFGSDILSVKYLYGCDYDPLGFMDNHSAEDYLCLEEIIVMDDGPCTFCGGKLDTIDAKHINQNGDYLSPGDDILQWELKECRTCGQHYSVRYDN